MLFALIIPAVVALATPTEPLFEKLRDTPPSERVMAARDLYKYNLRRTDSATTFRELAQLRTLARELGDKPLECSVFDLQADYFSVNRGFNKLSLAYYREAIKLAKSYDLPSSVAVHTYKLGTFYNTFGKHVEANRYFVEALDQFQEVGYDKIPRIAMYLLDVSNFYYKVGDIETSRELARQALTMNDTREDQELNITNTIALCSQALGDEKEALNFFFKALKVAEQKNDSIWIGIISSNIGSIYFHNKEYDRAQPLLEAGYSLALKFGDPGIALGSAILLASNHISKGEMKDAEKNLRIADELVIKVNKVNRWVDYYNLRARWHEERHESAEALRTWRLYDFAKDSLQKVNNVAEVERVKWRWEMDKHQAEISRMEARARVETLMRNFIIAVLFLLMIISILVYNRRLTARRTAFDLLLKEEALLKSEKDRAEEALHHAKGSLAFFTDSLRDKNRIIEEFKAEIERLHNQVGQQPDEERLGQLDQLIQSHIMTDEAWREFQQLFDRVHYGFIARLRSKFDVITETDIRLLALIKLGLNNREMSNALGVTLEAIKKSRQRLRKKIDLPEEESLERIVSTI